MMAIVAQAVNHAIYRARVHSAIQRHFRHLLESVEKGRRGAPNRGAATLRALLVAIMGAIDKRVPMLDGCPGRIFQRLANGGYWRGPLPHPKTMGATMRLLSRMTPLCAGVDRGLWSITLHVDGDPAGFEADMRRWDDAKNTAGGDARARRESAVNAVSAAQSDACDGAPKGHRDSRALKETPACRPRSTTSVEQQEQPLSAPHKGEGPRTHAVALAEAEALGRMAAAAAAAWLAHMAGVGPTSIERARDHLLASGVAVSGRRGRYNLLRGLRRLAAVGWLEQREGRWYVARSDPHPDLAVVDVANDPSEERPSPRMVAHLERAGIVFPDRLSKSEAIRVQRRLHTRRVAERLSPRQLRAIEALGGDVRRARFAHRDRFPALAAEAEERAFRRETLPTALQSAHAEYRHRTEVEQIRDDAYSRPRIVAPVAGEVARGRPPAEDAAVESANWRRVLERVREAHGDRVVYDLRVNGGGSDLILHVDAAAPEAIEAATEGLADMHPLAIPRLVSAELQRLAAEEAIRQRSLAENARWAEIDARNRARRDAALAEAIAAAEREAEVADDPAPDDDEDAWPEAETMPAADPWARADAMVAAPPEDDFFAGLYPRDNEGASPEGMER